MASEYRYSRSDYMEEVSMRRELEQLRDDEMWGAYCALEEKHADTRPVILRELSVASAFKVLKFAGWLLGGTFAQAVFVWLAMFAGGAIVGAVAAHFLGYSEEFGQLWERRETATASLTLALCVGAWITVEQIRDAWHKERNPYPLNWDTLRRQVYARAGYRCQNCGQGNTQLHAHHIVPLFRGGTNALTNLACLCDPCHRRIHPHMRRGGAESPQRRP